MKSILAPPIAVKDKQDTRAGSVQKSKKVFTETPTPPPERKLIMSSDNKHQRYQSQGISREKDDKGLVYLNSGFNCEWIKPKKRSISTIKNNRRNIIYNCKDYNKGGSVYLG